MGLIFTCIYCTCIEFCKIVEHITCTLLSSRSLRRVVCPSIVDNFPFLDAYFPFYAWCDTSFIHEKRMSHMQTFTNHIKSLSLSTQDLQISCPCTKVYITYQFNQMTLLRQIEKKLSNVLSRTFWILKSNSPRLSNFTWIFLTSRMFPIPARLQLEKRNCLSSSLWIFIV